MSSHRKMDCEEARRLYHELEHFFGPEIEYLAATWRRSMASSVRYLSIAGGGISALIGLCVLADMFGGDVDKFASWRHTQLRGVSGTSFGSLLACMICAGMNWTECTACIVDMLHDGVSIERSVYSYLADTRPTVVGEEMTLRAACAICERAFSHRGVTFEEAFALTGIELVIVCCDIRSGAVVELCHRTAPSMTLVDAMRSSCAIPIIMPPLAYRGMTLVDGGMSNNFAVTFRDTAATLFLSTRFEGLADAPGVVSWQGAYEATKILIDSQYFIMVRSGMVPPCQIVMSPRLFGFLSLPFATKEEALQKMAEESTRSIRHAFSRSWIQILAILHIVVLASARPTEDPALIASAFERRRACS